MADYRKSFNFRNGVQVDNDNFLVNSTGLVGIGTTVPTEALDVRGNVKVVGLATVQEAFIAIGTALDFRVGITSIHAGLITATTSSGIVTYYGDGRYLQGLPTSQWVDIDAGLGYTSIYAAGNVGVATNDPRYTFQVGGNTNVSNFSSGVGINSTGDINATGIMTAAKFYGWGIGVTGLNAATAISGGYLDNDRLPESISVTGIITASRFIGNLTGDVVGIATTARDLTSDANVTITAVNAGFSTSGIATVHTRLHLDGAKIGVNTSSPASDIEVRNTGISSVQLISSTKESRLVLGKVLAGAGSSYGHIQFGNTDTSYASSNIKSLDIFNFDTGSINQYLHAGDAGIGTGRWGWIYGQNLTERMSLTYDGKLGVGKTDPDHTLHVVGTSTVTGNAWVGGDFSVSGNFSPNSITASGNIIASGKVGVVTSVTPSAPYDLVVGGDPTTDGVGIGSTGIIRASGTITADKLSIANGTFVVNGVGTARLSGIEMNSELFFLNITGGNTLVITVPGVGVTQLSLG
jgi:hypothetical protein